MRKILQWILATPFIGAFFALSLVLILLFSISFTVKDKDTVKNILRASGVYEKGPDMALSLYFEKMKEQARKSDRELSTEEILGNRVAEEDLRRGLKEIFPPEWLEAEAEKFIDEVYIFLEGEKESFSYSLILNSRMEKAGGIFVSYLKNKLATLPVCMSTAEKNFDLFTATCRPRDVNIAEANEMIDKAAENIKKVNLNQNLRPTPEAQGLIKPLRRILTILPSMMLTMVGLLLLFLSIAMLLIPGNKARWYAMTALLGTLGLFTLCLAAGLLIHVPARILESRLIMNTETAHISTLVPTIQSGVRVLENSIGGRLGAAALISLGLAATGVIFRRKSENFPFKKIFSLVMVLAIILIGVGLYISFVNTEGNQTFILGYLER